MWYFIRFIAENVKQKTNLDRRSGGLFRRIKKLYEKSFMNFFSKKFIFCETTFQEDSPPPSYHIQCISANFEEKKISGSLSRCFQFFMTRIWIAIGT